MVYYEYHGDPERKGATTLHRDPPGEPPQVVYFEWHDVPGMREILQRGPVEDVLQQPTGLSRLLPGQRPLRQSGEKRSGSLARAK